MAPVLAEQCAPGVTPASCPIGSIGCVPCEPQTLPELEGLVVQLIGFIWIMTGVVFFGLFIFNSYLYMFNKVEDAKKKMNQWIIGLLLILFSQPIVATVMKMIIREDTQCYESLRQPGFTFFFPQVCIDEEEETP